MIYDSGSGRDSHAGLSSTSHGVAFRRSNSSFIVAKRPPRSGRLMGETHMSGRTARPAPRNITISSEVFPRVLIVESNQFRLDSGAAARGLTPYLVCQPSDPLGLGQ
jgi:hypothetical protein